MGKKYKYDKYKMEVKNLACNENVSKRYNHLLLPRSIRGLIIGKSGCGKTTLLINHSPFPGWLDYNNINIFGKVCFNQSIISSRKLLKRNHPKK